MSRVRVRQTIAAGGIFRAGATVLLIAGGLIIPPTAWAGVWQPTGPLNQARDGATATLLLDGTVLVAGGEGPRSGDPFTILKSAERFDPKTGGFERTGDMGSTRIAHAALRLADGRVLIFGGLNLSGVALATVEVFDPATGVFTSHGRLTVARIGATVTLLSDGRVLVVGGAAVAGGKRRETAELYDPATGASMPTGSMAGPRAEHAAIGLPDGRVLILAGNTTPAYQGTRPVEIYDPATGTFTVHGEIAERSGRQTATLLPDGRILITGGFYRPTPDAPVEALATAEIYDPRTGQSQGITPLSRPRYWHVAVALQDGGVLLLGGCDVFKDGPATESVERVDPISGQVSASEPMAVPRGQPGAVLLQAGRVLVFGGFPAWGEAPTTHAEVYTP